jgi:hypothetical protein
MKGSSKRYILPATVTVFSCIASSKAAWGRAVDFIRQQHLGESWTAHEHKPAVPGGGVLLQDLGPRDIRGHQVRRELNPREAQFKRSRQAVDEQRFRQARHAHQKTVPARKQRVQSRGDDLFLADNDFGDLLLQ